MNRLTEAVRWNPVVDTILDRVPELGLPSWYLGAGGITQTVWNQLHEFDPTHGIKDYDLVYFDPNDLTKEGELAVENRVRDHLAGLCVTLDVKNEARMHLWYEQRFGRTITAYGSTEDAVATWPSTASCVGVRREEGELVVCAPFGLDDLFDLIVRPNKALIDQTIYEAKTERWRQLWPRLTILPW